MCVAYWNAKDRFNGHSGIAIDGHGRFKGVLSAIGCYESRRAFVDDDRKCFVRVDLRLHIMLKISLDLGASLISEHSRKFMISLLRCIDWVVVPSIWPETFGLVVSEAWEARRPILASAIGSLGERIINEQNGLTFQAGSDAELARLMLRCAGNRDLWRQLESGIRDEITLKESWERHKALLD
jgi:glycosyltransferase involved in cell wall biosynthesis